MVFDTTYRNDEYDEQSDRLLGESFRFLEKIRMGGVGSARFVVASLSPKLDLGKLKFSETDYGNIELRPKGIIVHYSRKLERFSWIITYYKLVIYSANCFSIHANGEFVKFKKNNNYKGNKKFILKMMQLKTNFMSLDYYG